MRARISDERLNELLDAIAVQNMIVRDTEIIMQTIDPDTLAFHRWRLGRIISKATAARDALIAQMEREKQEAKNGRENS